LGAIEADNRADSGDYEKGLVSQCSRLICSTRIHPSIASRHNDTCTYRPG
jgi:hypothetical protein